jgi:hypothetical protein
MSIEIKIVGLESFPGEVEHILHIVEQLFSGVFPVRASWRTILDI